MTLSEYRNSLGLTQKEMSEALDIHQASLARSEKAWPNVSPTLIMNISRVFGSSVVYDFPEGGRFLTDEEAEALEKLKRKMSEGAADHLPDV